MIETGRDGSDERLRRIEVITDAKLSVLDVEDVFDELLDRVRNLLDVDTAAVLLLDVHAQQLVTTAASGLEENMKPGLRISADEGLLGRIARDGQPIVVDDAVPDATATPAHQGLGIRSWAGVPLLAGGEVVGVLHVGSLKRRRFDADDMKLLQLAADRISLGGQIRSNKIDRAAALALQRSLLPTRLPRVYGVDLAARYVPGHDAGVGGDWYDVFTLPSGWLGVAIGDVSGHGLRSAVVMGRLRSALRAYALICDDPADALIHLDRKVHHFEAGNLASVVYAMITPDRSAIHISIAGHPRPFLAAPDGPATMPAIPVDAPLGFGRPTGRRRHAAIEFPPGAVLVCYTDGLVERRGELIDIGLERLRRTIRPASAETVCANIMAAMGAGQPADDIAVLAIQRDPTPA